MSVNGGAPVTTMSFGHSKITPPPRSVLMLGVDLVVCVYTHICVGINKCDGEKGIDIDSNIDI